MPKTEVLSKRLLDINPELELTVITEFIKDERIPEILDAAPYDFVIDAIDTLSPKVFLIQNALQRGLKIISSMGAGAKTDITQIKLADISKSYNCTLAKAVRKRLNKLGIRKGFPVVFTSEFADENAVILCENEQNKLSTVGTISYMPATFGNFIAAYVINDLLKS
jgi:tRNA A37 threonylcarbamoyladenosine dehydratase